MSTHGFRYLLDTNIVTDLIRNPSGSVAQRILRVGQDTVCTSIIVACELRYGAAKKGSERLSSRVAALLDQLTLLPLAAGTDHEYALIRDQLERAGTPIGPNDLLIAAHARALGLTLVTANVGEFARVSRLEVQNWLAA